MSGEFAAEFHALEQDSLAPHEQQKLLKLRMSGLLFFSEVALSLTANSRTWMSHVSGTCLLKR